MVRSGLANSDGPLSDNLAQPYSGPCRGSSHHCQTKNRHKNFLFESSNELLHAVKSAARANVKNLLPVARELVPPQVKLSADAMLTPANSALSKTTDTVIAIGTSCGGTQALEVVLSALPTVCPGIVVVQHMPEKFTAAFAQRLNSISQIEVREAQNGDRVIPGRALISPGGKIGRAHV